MTNGIGILRCCLINCEAFGTLFMHLHLWATKILSYLLMFGFTKNPWYFSEYPLGPHISVKFSIETNIKFQNRLMKTFRIAWIATNYNVYTYWQKKRLSHSLCKVDSSERLYLRHWIIHVHVTIMVNDCCGWMGCRKCGF